MSDDTALDGICSEIYWMLEHGQAQKAAALLAELIESEIAKHSAAKAKWSPTEIASDVRRLATRDVNDLLLIRSVAGVSAEEIIDRVWAVLSMHVILSDEGFAALRDQLTRLTADHATVTKQLGEAKEQLRLAQEQVEIAYGLLEIESKRPNP